MTCPIEQDTNAYHNRQEKLQREAARLWEEVGEWLMKDITLDDLREYLDCVESRRDIAGYRTELVGIKNILQEVKQVKFDQRWDNE